MPELHPITKALVAEQKRQGLNGTEMAAKLGVTTSTWSLVSHGHRGLGPKVIAGAVNFPKVNVNKLLREAANEEAY